MTIIDKLASSLNRRDELPNQKLAKEIADKNDKKQSKSLLIISKTKLIAVWHQMYPCIILYRKCWQGPPQRLLEELESVATREKIDLDNRNWPKAPNYLSRRLNQIGSNLLEGLGIEVKIDRITVGEAKGRATVKVRKVSPLSSLPLAEARTHA